MHQNAEGHMKEYNTQAKIKEMLISLGGFRPEEIKAIAGTGLIIDINGEGPEGKGPVSLALRADIDGLEMPENNPDLPYRSQTKYAHMCGHDGHTATMIMAGCILNKNKALISKGSKVRLMFQPAEEGPGGAKPMIEEGALDSIDEVYGLHNVPNAPAGMILVKSGPVMASISGVKITIKGKGGHSSMPHLFNDVISAGA
jgi:amidohydrolase